MNTTTKPVDRTEAERIEQMHEMLKEWGFNSLQIHLLHDAVRESGLRLESATLRNV